MTSSSKRLFLYLIRHAKRHHLDGWPEAYDSSSAKSAVEDAKLSYGDALAGAKLKIAAVKAGHLAGQIARFCQRNELPPVNSLLVNARTRVPGDSYLGGDPMLDLFAALCFEWTDEILDEIDASVIEVAVFKDSYW